MGTSENRDCQWASRSALKDFAEDALSISVFLDSAASPSKNNGVYEI